MIYFSTWMYEESPNDGGLYMQVGGTSSSNAKRLIYWRCVLVFFTLAQRYTRDRDDIGLCLFTNTKQIPAVDGVDLESYLNTIGVRIIRLDYRWRPEFPNRNWYNQFYVFDILDYFEVHANDFDHFIIADSDCLAVGNLDALFSTLVRDGNLAIDVAATPDENINGTTRRVAATLYAALGGTRQPLVAPYFGGEFFGISGVYLGRFLAIARDAFLRNNRLAQSSKPYLTEEAHLLSYAFVQLGIRESNSDIYVRRIWTTWKSNNTRQSDLDLVIWHVPAEKMSGIKKLARALARNIQRGNMEADFSVKKLSFILGVGKRRWSKLAASYVRGGMRRIAGFFQFQN